MNAMILLIVIGGLFVLWLVTVYRLRHEAKEVKIFEIWKFILKVLVVLTVLIMLSITIQYLIVGEYWT